MEEDLEDTRAKEWEEEAVRDRAVVTGAVRTRAAMERAMKLGLEWVVEDTLGAAHQVASAVVVAVAGVVAVVAEAGAALHLSLKARLMSSTKAGSKSKMVIFLTAEVLTRVWDGVCQGV